jgi:flagellar protein FliS
MDAAIRDAYLETQIVTATPQRLRLMLIEEAIRRLRAAQATFEAGRGDEATTILGGCRDILTELMAGIEPDRSPLARRVLSVYVFLFSTLVEVQFGGDAGRLPDMLRVLEEERQTWQAVCEQMPHRPAATATPGEEVAPQRVAGEWSGGYRPHTGPGTARSASAALSLEA